MYIYFQFSFINNKLERNKHHYFIIGAKHPLGNLHCESEEKN